MSLEYENEKNKHYYSQKNSSDYQHNPNLSSSDNTELKYKIQQEQAWDKKVWSIDPLPIDLGSYNDSSKDFPEPIKKIGKGIISIMIIVLFYLILGKPGNSKKSSEGPNKYYLEREAYASNPSNYIAIVSVDRPVFEDSACRDIDHIHNLLLGVPVFELIQHLKLIRSYDDGHFLAEIDTKNKYWFSTKYKQRFKNLTKVYTRFDAQLPIQKELLDKVPQLKIEKNEPHIAYW